LLCAWLIWAVWRLWHKKSASLLLQIISVHVFSCDFNLFLKFSISTFTLLDFFLISNNSFHQRSIKLINNLSHQTNQFISHGSRSRDIKGRWTPMKGSNYLKAKGGHGKDLGGLEGVSNFQWYHLWCVIISWDEK
jgi:hypothetical protein